MKTKYKNLSILLLYLYIDGNTFGSRSIQNLTAAADILSTVLFHKPFKQITWYYFKIERE